MRIALWHDLPPGGGRRALDELSRNLSARHRITTYRIGETVSGAKTSNDTAVPVVSIPFKHRRPVRFALYWNDWLEYRNRLDLERVERELGERLSWGKHDLVLTSTMRGAHAPALMSYVSIPSVYYCHEPPRRFYEPWCRPEAAPLTLYERVRLYIHLPTRRLMEARTRRQDVEHVRSATVVLTNSSYSAARIREIYRRPASVSYLGVEPRLFRPEAQIEPANYVLSVGAFEVHKGFEFLLQAIARIPSKKRPKLVLAGAGGHPRMPSHLYGLAARLGVELEILIAVDDRQLASLYRSAAVFVFGARAEPFGLVILEAMASGLPVVAVDEGGVGEIVSHGRTGYLTARDPERFAESVKSLLDSKSLRSSMGSAARAEVERRWTWDQAAARLEAHLLQTIEGEFGIETRRAE